VGAGEVSLNDESSPISTDSTADRQVRRAKPR
jgi:hypothetical protein